MRNKTRAGQALSTREVEVAKLITQGMSNQEIGVLLGISYQTVKNHVWSMCVKLECVNRTQIAMKFVIMPSGLPLATLIDCKDLTKTGSIELVYVPTQTQTLQAGVPYKLGLLPV